MKHVLATAGYHDYTCTLYFYTKVGDAGSYVFQTLTADS